MGEPANFKISTANPEIIGMHADGREAVFAISVKDGADAELLLYRENEADPCQIIPLPEEERIGEISAVSVTFDSDCKLEYNYRIAGRLCADPLSRNVKRFHNPTTGRVEVRCEISAEAAAETKPLEIPYEDTILYKLHVKGFTQNKPAGVKHPGTFLGIQERIPYLKELGVNSLILMPVYEFEETEQKESFYELDQHVKVLKSENRERKNYWGYAKGLYFSPKESYTSGKNGSQEFAAMVDRLHAEGLECILEFYFEPDADARFVTDVLRYWRVHYAVDGFHLVGEGTWINAVVTDPLLKKSKILYTGFDTGLLYGDQNPRIRNLGVMNLGYEHSMRRFLKGDLDISVGEVSELLRRNDTKFSYINYFADQDGFTMNDMVSYGEKHNEENGESGRDGTFSNFSWNCGEEGPSKKTAVNKLRQQQLRNAFLMLLTSQGTPMIYAGDEAENSQNGNNNAWCQDNKTGWITWSRSKNAKEMQAFVADAIAFRKKHPILHTKHPVRMKDYLGKGYPDLSYHSQIAWMNGAGQTKAGIGAMYYGGYSSENGSEPECSIYIAYNMYWKSQIFALPDLSEGHKWVIKAETVRNASFYADGEEKELNAKLEKSVEVLPRSITILISVPDPDAGNKSHKKSGKIKSEAGKKTKSESVSNKAGNTDSASKNTKKQTE